MLPLSRYLFRLVVFVFLVRLCHGNFTWFLWDKVDLQIVNGLPTHEDLNLHCKSKDDDLGAHSLGFNETYEFRFKPNFFGNTLYFCRFWWAKESRWFDIYDEERDIPRCSYCWWKILPTGPCLFDSYQSRKYDLCDDWNPEKGKGNGTQGE